jgi:hypothetical protein
MLQCTSLSSSCSVSICQIDLIDNHATSGNFELSVTFFIFHYRKRLEIESEERMTKMKDEALGKLKQLGNSILGNFGMSLDNFNMKQDEKTGSWNIR